LSDGEARFGGTEEKMERCEWENFRGRKMIMVGKIFNK